MTKGKSTTKGKEETADVAAEENQDRRPDYVAIQYRQVRSADGIKTRREQLGVAWEKAGGGFVFRPHGMQVIQNDVHFFLNGEHPPSMANG